MALKDEILKGFFDPLTPKTSLSTTSPPTPIIKKIKTRQFRVFDEPPKGEINSDSNLRQSQDKLETKLKTNISQSQDKLKTNIGHEFYAEKETKDKHETELRTELKTNIGQSQDKLKTNFPFYSLVGLQRLIIILIYETCQKAREKKTPPLSLEHIAITCKTTISSARKTIQRLEKTGFIIRREFKNGRGGWTQYELPESVFQDILYSETQDKLKTNLRQTQDKLEAEPRTELKTPISSSSSDLNNKKTATTTTEQPLPEEWERIDVEPLNKIGLSKSHIAQIYKKGILTAEIVQESIYAFAFDLENNDKVLSIDKSPISFFLGIVLKNSFPYTKPDNYESPKDRAMRIYLMEQTKFKLNREAQEKELFDVTFSNWMASVSDDELKNQLPSLRNSQIKFKRESQFILSAAREYFRATLWPDELKKIVECQEGINR